MASSLISEGLLMDLPECLALVLHGLLLDFPNNEATQGGSFRIFYEIPCYYPPLG